MTGDQLPQHALDTLTRGHCPVCEQRGFIIGPQGGAAINIECAFLDCRARFNVVMFGGRCLMAQEIECEAQGGSVWPSAPASAGEGSGHSGSFS
jgi:hypothetical protein